MRDGPNSTLIKGEDQEKVWREKSEHQLLKNNKKRL